MLLSLHMTLQFGSENELIYCIYNHCSAFSRLLYFNSQLCLLYMTKAEESHKSAIKFTCHGFTAFLFKLTVTATEITESVNT